MKLSSDETRAIAFVLGLIGLATVARLATRPRAGEVPAAAEIDSGALEDSSEQALQAGRARGKPLGADERIDVNSASVEELDRLPGVGPGLAARIVQERERGGAFDSAADLRTVRGIGPALLAKLDSHLAFGIAPGLSRRTRDAAPPGARAQHERGEGRQRGPSAGGSEPVDLNRASMAQLDALPGVGPALAARIIAKRDSLNGFQNVEDLRKVRGIGAATLERLRPRIRL